VTIAEALREGESYLAERGIETPRVDAELLLEKTLGLARTELYAGRGRPVEGDRLDEFRALLGRRGRHEPAAYVLGEWGFRGLTLRIDPRVLIPRPETEVVVERCLALLDGIPDPEVLDVGTGSGAIALAIADEHPRAHVTAFDNSLGALEVARENSETTGLGDRVRLVEHDLTSGFGSRCFDLIVSNPPYVAPDEIESLEPEVRDWEPREALVGAGLADAIAAEAIGALKPGGALVLEVALGQAQDVAERLPRLGYEGVKVTRDLSGIERVVEGRR
jgi:release factor glutamine methyltransferase